MTRIERDCVRRLQASTSAYSLSLSANSIGRRAWASALFVGFRLTFALAGDDDGKLDEWLIALPDIDLPLPGYFVASAELIQRGANSATIELLVVEA